MHRLKGTSKHHDWGSTSLIPEFTGQEETGQPVAELWFGAHPLGSAELDTGSDLRAEISADPKVFLGPSTRFMLGDELPYLVKLIAPAFPLSLQVHPGRNQARNGFEVENARGIPLEDRSRVYKDATHKPEMLYALTEFDALAGFVVRRVARERLEGLDDPLATRLNRRLLLATGRGVRPVVQWVMDPEDGPTAEEVTQFSAACARRLATGTSPEPFIDQTMVRLQETFPGDPGILVAFLMNHVHLQPGETLFTPTGIVHSYQQGLGLEIMANSDNVVRAGLTSKHVDVDLFMETALFDGFPPTRIAPEHPTPGVDRFRSPVEDFELTVARPGTTEDAGSNPIPLPGAGPRILIGLEGQVQVITRDGETTVNRGEALFLRDQDGPALVGGTGSLAQCSVP